MDENKPLLKMDELELECTFDALNLDEEILKEARRERRPVTVAVAVLKSPGTADIVAYDVCEYGDGEGLRMVSDFIRRVKRKKRLREGETLERVLVECPLESSWVLPRPLPEQKKK